MTPLVLPLALAAPGADPQPGRVDFAREVRPILASYCFPYHSPDDKARKAGVAPRRAGRRVE